MLFQVFLAISIGLIHGLIFLPLMLSLFVRGNTAFGSLFGVHSSHSRCSGFCKIGSRKAIDEPESIAISTKPPSSLSDTSSLYKRHPPPETSPPRPPMLPPSVQHSFAFPAEFRPSSHTGGWSSPWLELKFADGFETSTTPSSILDAPPLVPTRPSSKSQPPLERPPPLPAKNFKI